NVAAEDSFWEQGLVRVNAAVWLAHVRGDQVFHDYVASFYDAYPEFELTSGWLSPYQLVFNEALLRYAELTGANASVRDDVRARFSSVARDYWLSAVFDERDPYRAWLGDGDHVWGSNRTVAAIGVLHAEAALLDPCDAAWHEQAARDYAHFFHGMNALGLTYLSNMSELGADNSIQEVYHAWFSPGTVWDRPTASDPGPAPGFLAGGPNRTYAPDPAYNGPPLEPPMSQPPAKSYLDFNEGWPIASWSVTEPSTSYQATYLLLLAHVAPGKSPVGLPGRAHDGSFCAGDVNSSGQRAHLRGVGTRSLSANELTLSLSCAPGPTFGLFFYGPATAVIPAGNGVVCIADPRRLAPAVSISSGGSAGLTLDLASAPFSSGPSAVAPGETWFFQTWHRDSIGAGFGTSDAMRVTFLP
ncbi:MAG: glycoside hydrolase family 9 protein, partial [Planctomycetota bacterium]